MNNKVSKLSYTSRDYINIYNDLIKTIPSISKIWNSTDENDPGIVLVKLMAMLGDMLSYNQDMQALEVYPDTVKQRKNAAQIFNLIGYRMHWYRSAKCLATLSNIHTSPVTIARYTKFMTNDESIIYTNVDQIELPSNVTNSGLEYQVELIQGIPVTPAKITGEIVADPNEPWHSIYDYNISADNIIGGRIYFDYDNVDEQHIRLIDSVGSEWIKVDNINTLSSTGKYFDFRVDEYDRPYIQLVSYWKDYNIDKFKLFFLLSIGKNGEIGANSLVKISSTVVEAVGTPADRMRSINTNKILIVNEASSQGYDPETAEEARIESAKWINTINTLITLDDFTRAVSRINGVAKCIAMDCMNAPMIYDSSEGKFKRLDKHQIVVYVALTDEYSDVDKSSFSSFIQTELRKYKMMPLDVIINYDDIKYCYWTVKGSVYLKEPVELDKAQELLVKINNHLRYKYSLSKVEFNKEIGYIDVIDTITNCDPLIHYVDIEPITYEDKDENPIDKRELTGKYELEVPNKDDTDEYPYYYEIHLEHTPIKPGSLVIRLEDGKYTAVDDGSGKIICNNGPIRDTGTITYFDEQDENGVTIPAGTIKFETSAMLATPIRISYQKNIISIAKYKNFSTRYFNIAPESIIQR